MKYLSLCSGIEAATVAWHPLGWEAIAYSEIEKFPSQVLAHHYPSVPNLGDMTKFKEWSIESNVDLLVGGTPCQSFSVAGLRKGLDDPRGNLMLTYLAIAKQYRPNWLVWENVPGVLSSNGGRDFGSFLGGLAECGYGFAYRVLDAQYFGVAQRRRRVFVVGYLGDWRPAAAVLFERHSLSGHPAPSREKREGAAKCLTQCFDRQSSGEYGTSHIASTMAARDYKCASDLISYGIPGNWIGRKPENGGNASEPMHNIAPCLTKTDQHGVAQPIPYGVSEKPDVAHCLRSGASKADKHESTTYIAQPVYEMHGQDSRVRDLGDTYTTVTSKWGTGGGNVPVTIEPMVLMDQAGSVMNVNTDGTVGTLRRETHGHEPLVMQSIGVLGGQHPNAATDVERSPTLTNAMGAGGGHIPVLSQSMAVRRLTPVECERLQGFPDNYTDIKPKGKATPDGPRYKALGNSMAVPVMAWIGQRIEQVEAICKQNK